MRGTAELDGERAMAVRPADLGPDGDPAARLSDRHRLRALADSGLSTASDPDMEYYAERVRTVLAVPVALVSLVEADQQVFPGMAGLPEPWASKRSTPLSHSFCQHVVTTATPLVVTDARDDPRVRDNLAIPDLGVVAYAGMPLTDVDGRPLGSLCAIDTEPRAWTAAELDVLADLARACSTTIRLRLADHLADRERARRDEMEQLHRSALDRTQLLLRASNALQGTTSADDIRLRVADLVADGLRPSYVGLSVVVGDRLHRLADPRLAAGSEYLLDSDLDAPIATATAVRERRLLHYPDRDAFDADFPEVTRELFRQLGLHSLVCAPLLGADGPLGAVLIGWDRPRISDPAELAVIAAIAGYTAQALERARVLQHRISVAHEMQSAMLSTLPAVDGLRMAAHYVPADARERVGGDWYDAIVVPGVGADARSGRPVVAVTVGDIMGHTTHAATIMGQVRSMMRQAGWELPGRPPCDVLASVESACAGLGIGAAGTAVHAHVEETRDGTGRWAMTWTNAGHPPPILLCADGTTALLEAHDLLFGFPHLLDGRRRDHRIVLEPGSTLVFYTDGLVESRHADLDEGIASVRRLLAGLHDRDPQEIVDTVVATCVGPQPDDDVAVLAVRFC